MVLMVYIPCLKWIKPKKRSPVDQKLIDGSWFAGSYPPVDMDTSGTNGSLHKS
jgi:hypothetical protein